MQTEIRIPHTRLESFKNLSELEENAYKELYAKAAQLSSNYTDKNITELASEVNLIDKTVFKELIRTTLTIFPPLISSGKTSEEFVDGLVDSFSQQSEDKVTSELIDTLRKRLINLLSIPTLSVGAKALNVFYDNAKTYSSSRLLCDLRPVFGLDEDYILGAVIINTLKIDFVNEEGNESEIYITLDERDIDDLLEKLERQKNKIKEIKKLTESNQLKTIELNK